MAAAFRVRVPVLIFAGVFLFALPADRESSRAQLVVWNIGQGQWVTLVDEAGCWHFDTGGETAPWKKIMEMCRARRNYVSYSHWDWDHVSFAGGLPRALPEVCVMKRPVGRTSARKEKMMSRLRTCEVNPPFVSWTNPLARTANALSRVIFWRGVLIPGDSTSGEEKYWLHAFRNLGEARILILGHHGSATSTSRRLLSRIPRLRAAVASARERRYGHPHARVRADLSDFGVPLLRTEEWGHLIFDL